MGQVTGRVSGQGHVEATKVSQVKVVLTRSEVRICEWLGEQRLVINQKRGIKDARIGPQSSLQIDIDGLKGEFAFAKMFNLWPDLQLGQRPLHDVMSPLGGIDIKTTRHKGGLLLATKKKQGMPADWYALMWLENDFTLHFVGASTADQLLDDANLRNLGYGESYALDQSELVQPEEFKDLLANDAIIF